MAIDRPTILHALRTTLEPRPDVLAMWEGGAAAFDRVDEWSDIDLQIIGEDDRVEETFAAVEETLRSIAPIEKRFRLPEPTWHGHAQAFYRLEGASPYLMIDLLIMKRSAGGRLREQETHGRSVIHFDKEGLLGEEHIDREGMLTQIGKRLAQMEATFELFQPLVLKELNRGNDIEAVQYYHGMTLRPLIELLRINHAPARYTFHTRYVYYDLPADVIARLAPLFFPVDGDELRRAHADAGAWFAELLATTRLDDVADRLT
jgi:hypothetical protein